MDKSEWRQIVEAMRAAPQDIVVVCTADVGLIIGVAISFGILPLGFYLACRYLPLHYVPVSFFPIFVLIVLTIRPGEYLFKRCKFRFRKDARAVEVTIIRLIFPGRTKTLPFSEIGNLELRSGGGEGSPSLEMFTVHGKRWTLRKGTTEELLVFANNLASVCGWSTLDGIHWT